MVELSVEIAGLKFKNPVMNAAGPLGRDGAALCKIAENGAGGLVTKTISDTVAEVPRPCLALIDKNATRSYGLLNVETWSDLPYQQWLEEEYKVALKMGLPLIASVGYTPDQVRKVAKAAEECGVSAIEFSTHYLGSDFKPLIEVARTLKHEVDIPIFAKISPHTSDVSSIAKAVEAAGVDGIVAINSFGPCLHIDIKTGRPFLGGRNGYGWISGPYLKPLAVRCVSEIARSVKIPVIGVGGIVSGFDAIEFIMAGAAAVQICTGAMVAGLSVFRNTIQQMSEFMESNGYHCIDDIRGLALKHLTQGILRVKGIPPEINSRLCIECGTCVRLCPYGALKYTKSLQTKKLFVDEQTCYGCGLCVSACPTNAIEFKDSSARGASAEKSGEQQAAVNVFHSLSKR
jgi:dihydroorotate dehydrogenase subfamily 1